MLKRHQHIPMPVDTKLPPRLHTAWLSHVHHLQPQHLLKRIEIAVAVQKLIPRQQAERSNPTIHSFPNGVATLAQGAIVRGGRDRVFSASRRKYLKREQLISYPSKLARSPNTLKHFAKDHVGKTDSLERHFAVEPLRFCIRNAPEIVNPNGRVHDHHSNHPVLRPRRDSSRFPSHFTLPRNRRMPTWARVWMNKRRAASTVAFFVSIPPSRIARRIKLSSMSMLVRIIPISECVMFSYLRVYGKRLEAPNPR